MQQTNLYCRLHNRCYNMNIFIALRKEQFSASKQISYTSCSSRVFIKLIQLGQRHLAAFRSNQIVICCYKGAVNILDISMKHFNITGSEPYRQLHNQKYYYASDRFIHKILKRSTYGVCMSCFQTIFLTSVDSALNRHNSLYIMRQVLPGTHPLPPLRYCNCSLVLTQRHLIFTRATLGF